MKKPTDDFNPQPVLRRQWNLNRTDGTIRVKAVRCGKAGCTKCPHEFYAYFVYHFLGRYVWNYLGKCDRLGRPTKESAVEIRKEKKAAAAEKESNAKKTKRALQQSAL